MIGSLIGDLWSYHLPNLPLNMVVKPQFSWEKPMVLLGPNHGRSSIGFGHTKTWGCSRLSRIWWSSRPHLHISAPRGSTHRWWQPRWPMTREFFSCKFLSFLFRWYSSSTFLGWSIFTLGPAWCPWSRFISSNVLCSLTSVWMIYVGLVKMVVCPWLCRYAWLAGFWNRVALCVLQPFEVARDPQYWKLSVTPLYWLVNRDSQIIWIATLPSISRVQ